MTFEEWKEKHSDLIENVAITFFNYERGVDTKTCFDELEYLLQRAFKAGKDMSVSTKWHDLRKNPEDLPSRSDENEDKSNRVITDKGIGFYHYRKGKWYTSKDREAYLFARNVIAWCEIPKFKGEVKA